ncbi:MAG: hypothetical protein KBT18_03205 [Comamonas sp.]|nr:hypothetical protein [Candidatus Comamonas equi]
MPTTPHRWLTVSAAAVASLLVMACEQPVVMVRADTFPMGYADPFNQPIPRAPLFGSDDYLRSRDVLPPALADICEPLPAAVPLPQAVASINVIQPTAETAQSSEEQGGSSPASGMAQGITNAQGGGESNQHDGGKTNVPRE